MGSNSELVLPAGTPNVPEFINTERGVDVFRIPPGPQNLVACRDFGVSRGNNAGLLTTNCYHSDILFSEQVGGLIDTLNDLGDASSGETVLYLSRFSNLEASQQERVMSLIFDAAGCSNNNLVVIREESSNPIPIPKLWSRFEGEFRILPNDLRNVFSNRHDQKKLLNHWRELENDGRLAGIDFKKSLEFAASDLLESANDV